MILELLALVLCWMAFNPNKLDYNPSYVSPRTRSIIIDKHFEGQTDKMIALDHRLKPSTIRNYIRRYNKHNTILTEYEIKKKLNGNKPIPHFKILDDPELHTFVHNQCTKTATQPLNRYVDNIMCEYGIYISRDTINRMFKRDKWKYKVLSSVAMEASDLEEAIFWELVSELITHRDQMMFLDESNRNDKAANPTRARGPPGPVYVKVAFTRGTYSYSLLLVVGDKGVVAHKTYFGAVNEKLFNNFLINELSKHCNAYPMENSVIFLDNIAFHHNETFKQLVRELGIIAFYLPRYKPLCNLAEYCFRDIKRIEVSKCIYSNGELEGLISLEESVQKIKNKPYSKILKQIGYIK